MVCESRLMITKDVVSQQVCSVHGRLWFNESNQLQSRTFRTPCFLPNFVSIQKLEITDINYWSIVYDNDEQIQRLKQMLSRDGLFYVQKSSVLSLTLKQTAISSSSSLVQLLSSDESSLRTWFHALQLYSGIQRIIADPINTRHVKEMHALISFYEKYTSMKRSAIASDTDDVILRTQFTNILFKNITSKRPIGYFANELLTCSCFRNEGRSDACAEEPTRFEKIRFIITHPRMASWTE